MQVESGISRETLVVGTLSGTLGSCAGRRALAVPLVEQSRLRLRRERCTAGTESVVGGVGGDVRPASVWRGFLMADDSKEEVARRQDGKTSECLER